MSEAQHLHSVLSRFPNIELAVLFGSMARGHERLGSDLDLAVLLKTDDPGQLWEIDLAVAGQMQRTVDLVDLWRAPPLLRLEIAREGELILERHEGGWARFKVQAMLDWWDWAPIARRFHKLAAQRLREETDRGQA